jgi:integrase
MRGDLMRKRHQKGSLKIRNGNWIAQWWQEGHRRNKVLGKIRKMTKSEAEDKLADILAPINGDQDLPSGKTSFDHFVKQVYLPFYRRKWKKSTADTNVDRLNHHLLSVFGGQPLGGFVRDDLQDFLDKKAADGLSFSTIDHLRWDLKQIFDMAVHEEFLKRNPAALLFTPKQVGTSPKAVMTWDEVKLLFSTLESRELLVCMLATTAGMRPGEIFGLKWKNMESDSINIEQRVYRGKIDSPKTGRRIVALSRGLQKAVAQWKEQSGYAGPEEWVFPSENRETPLAKDNCWHRMTKPKLKKVDLDWVNFQVMRRTHASLMRELDVDPKLVADQLGHSVDVNLNVYTKTGLDLRKRALNAMESAVSGA